MQGFRNLEGEKIFFCLRLSRFCSLGGRTNSRFRRLPEGEQTIVLLRFFKTFEPGRPWGRKNYLKDSATACGGKTSVLLAFFKILEPGFQTALVFGILVPEPQEARTQSRRLQETKIQSRKFEEARIQLREP